MFIGFPLSIETKLPHERGPYTNLYVTSMFSALNRVFKRPYYLNQPQFMSSHSQVFYIIGVLKTSSIFPGKYLYQSLYFYKVARWRPATLVKKRIRHKQFLVNFAKSLKTSLYTAPPSDTSNNLFDCICFLDVDAVVGIGTVESNAILFTRQRDMIFDVTDPSSLYIKGYIKNFENHDEKRTNTFLKFFE